MFNIRSDRGESSLGFLAAIVAVVLVVILAITGVVNLFGGWGKTDGGHVAVVRNGGPLDNTKIRQIVPEGSGRTRIGLFSDMHHYPTSQRYFTISSKGSADSTEVVQVPTKDGVQAGIEGTAYFTVNTSDIEVLKAFDNAYGTRKFKCIDPSKSKAIWDGDEGFSCFLHSIFGPIIKTDLRNEIGKVRCVDLVASCALVQNTAAVVDPKTATSNSTLTAIEAHISEGLTNDLNSTLGGNFLKNVSFNLTGVELDPEVQKAISKAQASFAAVSEAQAKIKSAEADAKSNEARQKGYNNCPACQQIDILKALPQGITVYAPGSEAGISIPTK